jgi:hypothetical protein
MDYWDWEDTWLALVYTTCVIAILLGLTALCANHKITSYYLVASEGTKSGLVCVASEILWDMDETVFCSTDPQKALDVMKQANEILHK